MRRILTTAMLTLVLASTAARADGLLFGYEGNILPGDPGSEFEIFDACEPDCSRRLDDGHLVLEWGPMGDLINYTHRFASSSGPPPPPETLWIEWRVRSNQPIPATSTTCDAFFSITYRGISDTANMFQDAIVDREGGDFALGLDPDIFHTYRLESPDGHNYTMSVDGVVFNTDFEIGDSPVGILRIAGSGDCPGIRPQPVRNEWDFVRYGTVGGGEQMVSTNPPAGNLTDQIEAGLTSFSITFDQPTYLYVDDITVSVTGGIAPTVVATRRADNGPSDILEVFIDRNLPAGQTTSFTFDTGNGPQVVAYTRIPDIPASSTWGLITTAIVTLIAGGLVFRGRVTV